MKTKTKFKLDKFNVLIKALWKDKEKMLSASQKQEEIKKKYGYPEKNWNSLSELRKWRTFH